MLNVEEFSCPELRLAMCHVKEAVRIILHTVLVCRSIGGHRPIEPRAVLSELFDLTYMKTDEVDFEQELEQTARQFSEVFENSLARSGRAQLVLSFYTTKSRKQSIWNIIVGSDEKIVFEQWRVPVVVQPLRRHTNPADNLREEANLQASASQQVQQALHFVIGRANAKVEHLPPPPQTQAAYKFEVTFSADGKGSTLLPQGFGSSISQTIKHIPYIA
uniref:Autophagy-related protein 101 n=1 Tax=Alexandrium andersonii TaxID=327968 RepID=A0A7S2I962_9DINO|mmetsp:Transcript_80528/g.180158  ORF Transcript_80528/g.180158 Transcript_80528/m.180158 type:complete len:218 (+) Transcript_80528:128-781(+)